MVTEPTGWVLLTYRLPRDPSAARVSIWRKLKSAGALLLHDAAWVLPHTPRTRETFQWLADEARQRAGQATVWTADPLLASDGDALARAFAIRADEAYRVILRRLGRRVADRKALAAEYQRVRSTDYFNSEFGHRVREALMATASPRTRAKARAT